jgi:transposase
MRGGPEETKQLFSYVDIEERVAADHPLRGIRDLVELVLAGLSREFGKLYSHTGRPSIPPEHLLKATLLQAFFTVRSERQLMEQINYNILFRWFVGLSLDDGVWDASTFSKNRERLMQADVAKSFMSRLLNLPDVKGLLSSEHFSVDGTLIDAWASMKSFVPKDGSGEPPAPGRNGTRNFHKEKRSNATHASKTDPDAQLFRKGNGQSSRLCFMGHALMDNRNGLIVDCEAQQQENQEDSAQNAHHIGSRQGLRCGSLRACAQGPDGHSTHRHQWHGLEDWKGPQDRRRWPHHTAQGL